MEKKQTTGSRWAAALGISFVWFTTQYGGGFASGAQLKTYFMNYGIWCLITCVGAQAIFALYTAYIDYYARKHELYDYQSFNKSFYGRFANIFCPLFELVYIFTLLVVPAVAYSTGGTTLQKLVGIPYLLCTAIIGIFIFVVAVYGTAVVRKVATVLSVAIIVGLLAVFIPNIFVKWGDISANIGTLSAEGAPIGPALWSMFLYAAFQYASSPAIHSQHAQALPEPKDAIMTFVVGFIVNAAMVFVSTLGLMAIVMTAEFATTSTPVLDLITVGVGSAVLYPVLSILIILGSVSTAVNMVSAGTVRVCKALDPNFDPDAKPTGKVIITTLVLCIVGFCIAQFGLLTLVQKGYGTLSYLTLPVITVPYIIHAIYTRLDTKDDKK